MPYQESSFTESTSPFPRPARDYRWASWALLALVTFSATTAIIASVRLHRHANTRNHITQELTAIETQATAHAGVVWRGLTMLLAKEQMLFIQVRGEEQQGRINLFNRIEALQEIEKQGGVLNQKLGFSPSAELLKELDDRTLAFLGDVQGTFALMDLSTQQVRRRLRYHDMKFADFKESLSKIKVRDDQIAAAAANIANGVTVLASGITLLTATLFVFRLGRLRIQRDRALRHQALHDPLTNLPNRRQFQQRFNALTPDQRQNVAILFVDLDGFKRVNDSYGHQTGDQLLVTTVSRIGACLGPNDILSRQGGDEFILLVKSDPVRVADQIQKTLAPPFTLDQKEVFISASIGILPNVGSLTADQAAQRADIAMYAAKQAGKAQAMVFADHMLKGAPQRLALE
ncbi:MAG: GGDEF domain-containing protein, partial [Algisphaera sp.]